MIISTQTDRVFRAFGEEEGLRVLKTAGYDAVDYSMFFLSDDSHPLVTGDVEAHARRLREASDAVGLPFNQAHAVFPGWREGKDDYNAKMPDRVDRSIRMAGILGAKCIVVHPIPFACGGEYQKEWNMEYYTKLGVRAREYGVKIALENMWGYDGRRGYIISNVCSTAAELADYYDTLNDPKTFTVCLDLGHCGLIGEEPDDAIRILGHDRLGAMPLHDNNYRDDSHTVPYDFNMKMDWEKITKAFGEIDYTGDFTYEADNFVARHSVDTIPAAESYMVALARVLASKIDAARPAKG